MKKPLTGFDLLAPVYDRLARLVFGKSIIDAQVCFLDVIPSRSKVLILGGGTGWLLAALVKKKPECEVWYIEPSQKMIAMARQNGGSNNHFVAGTIDDMPLASYDVVITNFFLDLFSEDTLHKIVPMIRSASAPSVLWLVTEFVNQGRWWQRILLRVMYIFFRVTCRIEAKTLPDWQGAMRVIGFEKIRSQDFYRKFILSSVWSPA